MDSVDIIKPAESSLDLQHPKVDFKLSSAYIHSISAPVYPDLLSSPPAYINHLVPTHTNSIVATTKEFLEVEKDKGQSTQLEVYNYGPNSVSGQVICDS